MVAPFVRQADVVFEITVGSTDVVAGDALYFDGTDWELADATDETKFCEAFAVASYSAGDVGSATRKAVVVDNDAPYTQGSVSYLSAATPGDMTETRPTGANNLVQVLGFALSTSELVVEAKIPYEYPMTLSPLGDATAAPLQNVDYTGFALEATSEACGYTCQVPQNAIALVAATLWWTSLASTPTLDASDTYTIDVSAGVDDETVTATTDGIAAASLAVTADDLANADVSAAFDTSGIIQPGNIMGIDVDKAAEGTGGDDPIILGLHLVFRCV